MFVLAGGDGFHPVVGGAMPQLEELGPAGESSFEQRTVLRGCLEWP